MLKLNKDETAYTYVSDGFLSIFSTRKAGNGKKIEAIKNFLTNNKLDNKIIIRSKQIHGTKIRFIKKNEINKDVKLNNFDGLITKDKRLALTVLTADCLPVSYWDTKLGLFGISHQGWKGSLENMMKEMVNEFLKLGSKIKNIQMAIGPSINSCCYNLDKTRTDLFIERYPKWKDEIIILREKNFFLDIPQLNYLQALSVGVKKKNITKGVFCTFCGTRFFSYRKNLTQHKKLDGEMFNIITKI